MLYEVITRALFPALDLPRPDLGDAHQHLDEHVDAQVQAGEKPAALAVLGVDPPAWLDAAPSQPAFPSQKTAPVAAAGNAEAQGAVHEYFQAQFRRAGRVV